MTNMTSQRPNYAFIDASNLFYGGEKSLGWRIDYLKLFNYLKSKYSVKEVFYFGGVEIYDFKYDYLLHHTVPLQELSDYLSNLVKTRAKDFNEDQLLSIVDHIQRVKFYLRLQAFGYRLFLKPVKLYIQDDGTTRRKANCDVDNEWTCEISTQSLVPLFYQNPTPKSIKPIVLTNPPKSDSISLVNLPNYPTKTLQAIRLIQAYFSYFAFESV